MYIHRIFFIFLTIPVVIFMMRMKKKMIHRFSLLRYTTLFGKNCSYQYIVCSTYMKFLAIVYCNISRKSKQNSAHFILSKCGVFQ